MKLGITLGHHDVPAELHDNCEEFVRRPSFGEHVAPHHARTMEELGVADHLEFEGLVIEAVIMTGAVPDKHVLMQRAGRLASGTVAA